MPIEILIFMRATSSTLWQPVTVPAGLFNSMGRETELSRAKGTS